MPNVAAPVLPAALAEAIETAPGVLLDREQRRELLERALEMPAGRERPNRFWRIDVNALDFSALHPAAYATPAIASSASHGVAVYDLREAAEKQPELLERVRNAGSVMQREKFAAITAALCNGGALIHVKADAAVDEPITLTYRAGAQALFPCTAIVVERGAQCTVIERIEGEADAFVCGLSIVAAGEGASVTHAVVQQTDLAARSIGTRLAAPGKDATVTWCSADLGGSLALTNLNAVIDYPGAEVVVNTLFFPRDDQHVDVISTVDHSAGESTSETLVKSAAIGRGQARYLGNIRIAAHAQGTLASLRDDALLLSPKSHIDSIPALEIAANDVKAYHGATVGALDPEQIFYMCSRGIPREAAEKMVALGFFEPVIERFPTNALREELRRALEAKVSA